MLRVLGTTYWISFYAGPISDRFILQEDNVHSHIARLTQQYLEAKTIYQMVRPAGSPKLYRIEHVCYALGRRISGLQLSPQTLSGLRAALSQQWALLHVELTDKIISRMRHR